MHPNVFSSENNLEATDSAEIIDLVSDDDLESCFGDDDIILLSDIDEQSDFEQEPGPEPHDELDVIDLVSSDDEESYSTENEENQQRQACFNFQRTATYAKRSNIFQSLENSVPPLNSILTPPESPENTDGIFCEPLRLNYDGTITPIRKTVPNVSPRCTRRSLRIHNANESHNFKLTSEQKLR